VNTEEGRGLLEQLKNYVQTHDVMVSLPGASHLTLSSRNIDNGELNLSLKFDQEESSTNASEGKHITLFNIQSVMETRLAKLYEFEAAEFENDRIFHLSSSFRVTVMV
jgi:hypothetical protein